VPTVVGVSIDGGFKLQNSSGIEAPAKGISVRTKSMKLRSETSVRSVGFASEGGTARSRSSSGCHFLSVIRWPSKCWHRGSPSSLNLATYFRPGVMLWIKQMALNSDTVGLPCHTTQLGWWRGFLAPLVRVPDPDLA
jgi:hypothetical protein